MPPHRRVDAEAIADAIPGAAAAEDDLVALAVAAQRHAQPLVRPEVQRRLPVARPHRREAAVVRDGDVAAEDGDILAPRPGSAHAVQPALRHPSHHNVVQRPPP